MLEDDKKTSEIIMDKLYYFNVDKVTENDTNDREIKSLNFT